MIKVMRLFRGIRGRRLGNAANLVVAAYILASAAMPFAHHSLDCHLKSRTHCTACAVGSSANAAHDQVALADVRLNDAGLAIAPSCVTPEYPSLRLDSDRAPPAIG
jgi:hypothetical protein